MGQEVVISIASAACVMVLLALAPPISPHAHPHDPAHLHTPHTGRGAPAFVPATPGR